MGCIIVDFDRLGSTPTPSIERVGATPTAELDYLSDVPIATLVGLGDAPTATVEHLGGIVIDGSLLCHVSNDTLTLSAESLAFGSADAGVSKNILVTASTTWSAELIGENSSLFDITTTGTSGGKGTIVVTRLAKNTSSYDAVIILRVRCRGIIKDVSLTAEAVEDFSTYRGVFIQSTSGVLYSADEWDGSNVANGIAVQTDEVKLLIALTNAHTKKCIWGTRSNISGVKNSDAKATVKTYFNGQTETDAIIANASNSTAASYCKNFIFPNGQNGYMGAGGEWWTCLTYKAEIAEALSVCGGTALSGDYWCTTEQVGSNRAWAADWEGADLTNYNKSATSSVTVRAFGVITYWI